MRKSPGFRLSLASLWFRLTTLAIIGVVFAEALFLGRNRIQGWTFYLTAPEVVFEVAVRLLFGALVGMALASILTVLLAPFLYHFHSSRDRLVEWVTRIAVLLVLFPDSRYALTSLIEWSNRGVRFTSALLLAHFLFFAVAICIPRWRRELVTSLDGFLGEKMTKLFSVAAVIALVGLVSGEFAMARSWRTTNTPAVSQRPKDNILLVTFDAFTAEDMSKYGYTLPITPNIDAFARNATVFTNFYAGSTSTTPCIGLMITGRYSSESKVYGLAGQVPAENAGRSLPHEMRAGGYETAAFLTSPWAYHLANSLENGFEVLREPTFHPGGFNRLWEATRLLHQDSRIGSRVVEYFDLEEMWGWLHGIPRSLSFRIRPDATFKSAEQLIQQTGDGFFIWVHVIAPHHPYLPDPADQGKFIPEDELQSFREEPWPL
jgi:Sulfatase